MKGKVSIWAAVALFVGAMALASAQATPAPQATHNKTVEITGCFQQGPVAKEYLLLSNDGTTWGVTSADKNMYMNDYVGQTVTITGDTVHPSARLKTVASTQDSPTIQHYLRAMDVVVENTTCKK
jgi:hypothetical protein